MNTCFQRVAILALALAVGACASTPERRYYTLDMTPSQQPVSDVNIAIGRLLASEPLRRPGLLAQKSPTEIEYYALHEWVAGVDTLVHDKLAVEFGEPVAGRRGVVISGQIMDFGQVDVAGGVEAHVKIALAFRRADMRRQDSPLLERNYEERVPAGAKTPEAVVLALSRGLEAIAARIVADANGIPVS